MTNSDRQAKRLEVEHTPEPWQALRGENKPWVIDAMNVDDNDAIIADVYRWKVGKATDEPIDEANAHRIVAAVNACAGLELATLERLADGGLAKLLDGARELLSDEDECYEPGKAIVTAGAMDKIRAVLTTEPTDDQS